MIFWTALFLLLINNAKLNADMISCQKYNVRQREYYSDKERLYCENDDYIQYCGVPILYSYCICKGYSYRGEYNIINSNFLDEQLEESKQLLKKVYINDSFVDEIEVNAFNRVANLRELYLQNNNITTIGKGVFNVLSNLTVLDISNNQVSIIESKSFYGLSHLEKLNISYNKIQNISSDIFDKNLHSMRILDLSHNLITSIELTLISTKFYHQDNFLARFPHPTSDPDVVSINLELNLSFNKMKSFNFSQLHLSRLSLNNNNLDSLNNMLDSNIIEELDLSNNHLSEFNYVLESTTYLNLSDNILQNLNFSISNSSKIETLDVSQNLITKLEPNVLNSMSELNNLYLKNNGITELPIGIFNGLKNLKILSLSGNRLRHFEFGTFSGLSDLLKLDISNNSFNSIDYKTFHILSNLRILNIASNDLTTLDPNDILNYCVHIQMIILNDNPWNCKSLLNFTTMLKRNHINIIEGSNSNTKNHLGHACHDVVTEQPDRNHIIQNEIDDLKKLFESELRNSTFYHSFENYTNRSIQSPNDFNFLNDYFNKDFRNTLFYKYFNKNISINFPSQHDETFRNLTETLKLLNLQLVNLNQTNVLNSKLLNLTTTFENKFTSLDLYNKTILNPLNSNLAKLSKSVDEISNHFDKDLIETSFYQFIQNKFQSNSSGEVLGQVSQINQEALSSNISHAKLISASEKSQDVVEQIENLRGSFIAFMTILIMILLITLFLPIIKRFINPLAKKSKIFNTTESATDLALVQSIRHESLDEHNQLYNM